jgi:hypothetical protein
MALGLFTAGCLGDEEPRPATGAPREIGQLVTRLERATALRDFERVCDELFSREARERAGGEDCERLTASAAGGVARPSIEVTRIDVRGERARVSVVTSADGQARVKDVLGLRREGGEWRIEALE